MSESEFDRGLGVVAIIPFFSQASNINIGDQAAPPSRVIREAAIRGYSIRADKTAAMIIME